MNKQRPNDGTWPGEYKISLLEGSKLIIRFWKQIIQLMVNGYYDIYDYIYDYNSKYEWTNNRWVHKSCGNTRGNIVGNIGETYPWVVDGRKNPWGIRVEIRHIVQEACEFWGNFVQGCHKYTYLFVIISVLCYKNPNKVIQVLVHLKFIKYKQKIVKTPTHFQIRQMVRLYLEYKCHDDSRNLFRD